MKRTLLAAAILCVFAVVALAASPGQEKKPAGTKAAVEKTATAKEKSPQRKVPIPEDVLIVLIDEPTHQFGYARADFVNGNYAKSADEIRKGASFVKIEYERATPEGQRALYDETYRLAVLADEVQKGKVKGVEQLDKEFARAEQTLAFHHYLMTQKYTAARERKSAGAELTSAASHFEQSMKHAAHVAAADEQVAIKDAREMGRKLSEEATVAAEKSKAAIEKLGAKIQANGKRLEATEKTGTKTQTKEKTEAKTQPKAKK